MSAVQSATVIGYDNEVQEVTFAHHIVRPLSTCTKNELIAVAKFNSIEFRGKPAQWFSPSVIIDGIINAVKTLTYVESANKPSASSPRPTPSVSVPVASPSVSVASSLDGVVQSIVHNAVQTALDDFKAGVDEVKVAELVDNATSSLFEGFRHEVTAQIDAVRPKVTHISIANRPEPIKIAGVLHKSFQDILQTVSAGVHAYLVGSAGTGKSTIGEQVAEVLGVPFASKSVSGQTPESALVGYMAGGGNYVGTEFRRIFENGGVFLLDEVDNGNPNVLNVLNSALANNSMSFADGMVKRHPNFVAIATANTFGNGATAEYVGRNPIDKAFTNRFAFIPVEIDEDVEDAMLASVNLEVAVAKQWITAIRKARQNVQDSGLRVLVTPRNTLNGAKQISVGMPIARAFGSQITAQLNAEQSAKVLAGVTL